MAGDDASARGPIVLRIKLRYDDLDTMIARFAVNVGRSGLFLPTKQTQPVGTEIKFELRLANDTPALVGVGRVKHARSPDPANARAAFGIAVELMRVTREGRDVIMRMLQRRRELGLPDLAIPTPDDVEAARREPETNPRAETSGIVREAMAQIASAPVSEQILRPGTSPSERMTPASGLTALASFTPAPGVPVVEAIAPVAQLAPEPQRARRPRVSDVIARAVELTPASGLGDLVELDEARVDIGKVIARARTLAGVGVGDVDDALSALRDLAAAPEVLDIDAASAELAKQLGGSSVTRRARTLDTSAKWEAPPAVMEAAVIDAFDSIRAVSEPGIRAASEGIPAASEPAVAPVVAPVPLVTEAEAPPIAVRSEPARDSVTTFEPLPPALEPEPEAVSEPATPARLSAEVVADHAEDHDPAGEAAALASAIAAVGRSAHDDEDAGDGEPLDSVDLEPVDPSEATVVGNTPEGPSPYVARVLASESYAQEHEQLARSLDAQLAQAEGDIDDSEFAGGMPYTEGQAYADQLEARQQRAYDSDYARRQTHAPRHEYQADAEAPVHQAPEHLEDEDEDEGEEISDFDVVAEADADDAALLARPSEGELDGAVRDVIDELHAASVRAEVGDDGPYDDEAPRPPARPRPAAHDRSRPRSSLEDFAARLELDDDEREQAIVNADGIDPPSGNYTVAERYPSQGPPELEAALAEPSDEDYALESALEALDVGLDDLSLLRDSEPHVALPGLPPNARARRHGDDVPTERPGSASGNTRRAAPAVTPASPAKRAQRVATDDGVLIDFDDDDE